MGCLFFDHAIFYRGLFFLFVMAFNTLLDPVLGWTLALPLWAALLVLSLILTVIITIVYKFATDQAEMKGLKARIKELQAEMKKKRHDPKKMAKLQQEVMSVNLTYTKKSCKPTLYTFIPLILIFGWMNANLAFDPVLPDQPVLVVAELDSPSWVTLQTDLTVEGESRQQTAEQQVSWLVSGPPGDYVLRFVTDGGASATQRLVIAGRPDDSVSRHASPFKQTLVRYEKARPFGDFSLFGYRPGWLFTYILFSIALSIGLRKALKIH